MGRSVTDDTERTKLEKYLKKQGRSELVESLQAFNNEQLKNRLKDQAIHEQVTLNERDNDGTLKKAKATARELSSSYNEQLRMNKKICRYISTLLEDKGGLI